MISGNVFVFIVVLGVALGYAPGQYIPRSFYVIDQFGHQSAPVFIRNRRDIMNHAFRVKRGDAYASSSASASASSSAGGGPVYFGGPTGTGAQSFASSSSSASAGNGGYGQGQSYGGLGAGHDAGYQGPVLFSRFGEAEGTGVHVSGQAQGNKGAFSASSSSIDDQGKIKYSVQSGKY